MFWYNFVSWVIIAIEVLVVAFIVGSAIKNRKFSLTENAWYFIPSLLILYALYATDLVYVTSVSGEGRSIYAFINIIDACYDVYKPDIAYAELLLENDVYSVAFFIGVVIALGVFISFAINVVYYFFYSKLHISNFFKRGCDIVIAEDKDFDVYKKTYANSVLLLQECPNKDQKKAYREKGVVYFVCDVSDHAFNARFAKYVNNGKDYNFICLKEHDYTLKVIAVFKSFVKENKSENFYLHVEFDYKNYKSINEVVLEDRDFTAYLNCFNKYELTARKFVQNYPVTKFIPSDFFNHEKAIIKPEKNVNVFYVGFGKTSYALFNASTMNDKLVTEKDKKLTEKFISYYLYDKESCKDESRNKAFYNDRYFLQEYNSEEYFEPIEQNRNVKFMCLDIDHEDGAYDYQQKLRDCKDDFNNIVIALGADVENVDTAIKTVLYLRQHDIENYHIFIHLRTEREEYRTFFDTDKITFFGDESFTINHSVIVDETLMNRAKTVNRSYEEKRKAISKWTRLSSIKKLSNVYAGLNLRLKLNLLGYDLKENDGKNFDEKLNRELITRLTDETPSVNAPYEDYLFFNTDKFNSANALSYQEKLRWNAFYLNNGYALLKKAEVKVISESQIVKDNDAKKLHACLTTVEGLDEYHRLVAELLSGVSGKTLEEELANINTYKYDYSVLDVIKTFDKDSPMVIVKRS